MEKKIWTLVIIIPVFNGAFELSNTFAALDTWLLFRKDHVHIVFVDDGSCDETFFLLTRYYETRPVTTSLLRQTKNLGKGQAVRRAIEEFAGRSVFIGFTDVDLPFGLGAITIAEQQLARGLADVVIGDRTAGIISSQYSLYRRLAYRLFRLFLPPELNDVADTQSGCKFFRSELAAQWFSKIRTSRWVFDIELLLLAKNHEAVIYQLPVQRERLVTGRGGLSFLKDGPKILRDLFFVYWYAKQGKYAP